MQIMKLPEIERRMTNIVDVGGVLVGGGGPVIIQSMTNTKTSDVEATSVQIRQLADQGAELVRVAVPGPEDTAALEAIIADSPVPIIADVHFHFQRALEAIEAGVSKIRLNPGNIADRKQVIQVLDAAANRSIAVRVGVNAGSLPVNEGNMVDVMVDTLATYLDCFSEAGFENIVLSAKSPDAMTTIMVNRALSQRWDYPIHLGVTHAGTVSTGGIRSAASLGSLLADGIGDTIRISFAGDPVQEVRAAKELLCSLRLRQREGVELIACPTCGRLQTDLESITRKLESAISELKTSRPVRVAVMGCNVNGPGEAADADIAICAGKGEVLLYRSGKPVGKLKPDEIVQTVIAEIERAAGSGRLPDVDQS